MWKGKCHKDFRVLANVRKDKRSTAKEAVLLLINFEHAFHLNVRHVRGARDRQALVARMFEFVALHNLVQTRLIGGEDLGRIHVRSVRVTANEWEREETDFETFEENSTNSNIVMKFWGKERGPRLGKGDNEETAWNLEHHGLVDHERRGRAHHGRLQRAKNKE